MQPSIISSTTTNKVIYPAEQQKKRQRIECATQTISQTQSISFFQHLPREIKVKILQMSDGKSIVAFACTSKESNNFVETNLAKESEKAFLKARALMFFNQNLKLRANDPIFYAFSPSQKRIGDEPLFFSSEQLEKRYEDLKLALDKILPKHINAMIEYSLSKEIGIVKITLLHQTILECEEADKRIEIIKILLSKGADPSLDGVILKGDDVPVNALSLAMRYHGNDQKLMGCLIQAINDYKQKVSRKEKPEKIIQKVEEEERLSQQAYIQAIDLMFHDRKLRLEDKFQKPLLPEELDKRHVDLIQTLGKISPEHIEYTISFKDEMKLPRLRSVNYTGCARITTLLLHAILNIQDHERRLEIVNILLSRGAQPWGGGCHLVGGECLQSIDLFQEAKRIGDQKLINTLIEAWNRILKNKSV